MHFFLIALEKPQIFDKTTENKWHSEQMVHQSEQIVTKTGDEIELTCPVFVPSGQSHPKIIWSIDGLPISSTSMDYQILACFKINFCKIN